MLYEITFNSKTRLLANNGLTAVTKGDIGSDILHFTMIDSDGLLVGYTPYCVFNDGSRVEVVDGKAVIPTGGQGRCKVRFQLCFVKEKQRFYSHNVVTLDLNKVISG